MPIQITTTKAISMGEDFLFNTLPTIRVNTKGEFSFSSILSNRRLKEFATSSFSFHLAISEELAFVFIGGRLFSPNVANIASLVFEAKVPLDERTYFNNYIKRKLVFYLLRNLNIKKEFTCWWNFLL
jgi:hypothetical protein